MKNQNPPIIKKKLGLALMLLLALALSRAPGLGNFLSWQMTFFHEISHGLAALLTGGRIEGIEIHWDGSGLCRTAGGIRWLVSAAGYLGAAGWGLLIYLLAGSISKKYSHLLAGLLVALMTIAAVYYVREFQSSIIILIISLWYIAAIYLRDKLPLNFCLKLSGLYILLDALKAPLLLFGHPGPNDAATLAGLTWLPAFFWIGLWLAAALGGLALIWKLEGPKTNPAEP